MTEYVSVMYCFITVITNLVAQNHTYLLSQSFNGSEVWGQVRWVCYMAVIKVLARAGSRLKCRLRKTLLPRSHGLGPNSVPEVVGLGASVPS